MMSEIILSNNYVKDRNVGAKVDVWEVLGHYVTSQRVLRYVCQLDIRAIRFISIPRKSQKVEIKQNN